MLLLAGSPAAAEDTVELEPVVITAQRMPSLLKDTAATVTVINRKEIEESGAIKLGDILRTAPGVQITQYGSLGSTISIAVRGANSTQVLVLVDGRPINAPSTGMADLSWLPADRIERIEIMRTPAASLYGANAVGGVIQIFTREPSKNKAFNWNAAVGGFGVRTGSLEIEQPASFGAFRIGANVTSSRGARGNSRHHAADGDARFDFNLSGNRKLSLKMASHHDRMGLPGPMPPVDSAARTSTQLTYGDNNISSRLDHQKYRNASFQMDADILRGPRSRLSLKLYRDNDILLFFQKYLAFNFVDNTDHVTRMEARYNTDNLGGDLQFEEQTKQHKWVMGLNVRHERFATNNATLDDTAGTITRQNWKNDATSRAAFLEDEWTLDPQWILSTGLRWDHHGVYGNQLSPHISVLRRGPTNVRFSMTRAFRAPSMNDLFWPEDAFSRGNSQLTPEKARFFEIGLEHPFTNGTTVHLNLFTRRTKGMIAWAPTGPDAGFGPKWQPSNLNTLRTRGVELEISARLNPRLRSSVAYTYLNSRQETMDVVDGLTNAMAASQRFAIFTPKHYLKLGLDYNKDKFSTSVLGRYVSRRLNYYSNWNAFPAVTMDTKSLTTYFVLDWNASWQLKSGAALRLSIANLFDRNYAERFGNTITDRDYPMPGRSITVWIGREL